MNTPLLVVMAVAVAAALSTAPHDAGAFVRVAQLLDTVADGDCPTCVGTGEVEQRDQIVGGWIPVTCQSCDGSGERGAA